MAKEFLSAKSLSFEEVDVSADAPGRKEMIDKSGQMAVPVIVIDDEIVIGFDQAKLEQLVKE